ncbi:MAG: glutamate--tRNA ligase [Thermoanaerobacteraceae bacterium]|nr:glutamate--tRNA ligase [Thermoanaerobacteraceae bacterium]
MQQVRVRFAPSPTGPLHIGGARSALFNYLLAKKHDGKFIVRIEDTDRERSGREWEENILESLRWLGLEWDEGVEVGGEHGPYRQMERLDIYREYTQKLLESGRAYRCYCTSEELEEERERLRAKGELPRYLGRCRNLTKEQEEEYIAQGRKPVIRFKVPQGEKIIVDDLVRGKVSFDSDGVGDFIIVKSDGIPTYNFAVIIDDALMKISHVIRGEEHLSNTPRQILLYQALGIEPPRFAHISLILGKDGSKMSKRHGATSVAQYRQQGYLPEALVNFLALLGWSPEGEEEKFSLDELIELFSLDRVAKKPAVFDIEKLNWLNGVYIRQTDVEKIARMAVPYLQESGHLPKDEAAIDWEKLVKQVSVAQNYLSKVSDITDFFAQFYGEQVVLEGDAAREVLQQEQVPQVIALFKQKLQDLDPVDSEGVKKMLKSITKELKLGGKKVFLPLRVALTGKTKGPELHDLIPVLGVEACIKRVESSLVQAGK